MKTDDRYEKLLTKYDEKTSAFLVMRDVGKLVGAAVFGKSNTDGYPDDGEISAIYLYRDYIGKGHGHNLFAQAEAVLAAKGYRDFILDVLSDNIRAIAFYQKHGYKKVTERSIRLGVNDYALTVMRKNNANVIRALRKDDFTEALSLIRRAFTEFVAPDYSAEGIAEFNAFIERDSVAAKMAAGELRLWGAFENGRIAGVIAIRPPLHISLLFVDKEYHRCGIARRLFETLIYDREITDGHSRVTVNSSPYAVPIYARFGFVPTGEEQTVNGLRFTPMEYILARFKNFQK